MVLKMERVVLSEFYILSYIHWQGESCVLVWRTIARIDEFCNQQLLVT
jgi:hypothetical protein